MTLKQKKTIPRRKLLLLLLLVLIAAAAAALLLTGWLNTGQHGSYQTSEYELTYSGELQDIILFQKSRDEAQAMAATVTLGEQKYPLFTMKFNSSAGDHVIMVTDGNQNKIPVAFTMAAAPENLAEEETRTFWLAQEIVNELAASITIR